MSKITYGCGDGKDKYWPNDLARVLDDYGMTGDNFIHVRLHRDDANNLRRMIYEINDASLARWMDFKFKEEIKPGIGYVGLSDRYPFKTKPETFGHLLEAGEKLCGQITYLSFFAKDGEIERFRATPDARVLGVRRINKDGDCSVLYASRLPDINGKTVENAAAVIRRDGLWHPHNEDSGL